MQEDNDGGITDELIIAAFLKNEADGLMTLTRDAEGNILGGTLTQAGWDHVNALYATAH